MGGRPRIDGIGPAATLAFSTGLAAELKAELSTRSPGRTETNAPAEPLATATAADVTHVLGSPDVVTRGVSGREVWVWHRVPLDVVHTTTSGSVVFTGAGVHVRVDGVTSATPRPGASAVTVVVRLDESGHIGSVALRSSPA